MRGGKPVQWWVLGSAGLMLVGAFGPWLKALGQSVGGTDGSNDGWLVVVAALAGGLLFYATRTQRGAGIWALLGGVAGVGVTLYDRSHVQNAINQGGAFTQALVQIGWGLNLALAASASLAVAGAVSWFQAREEEGEEEEEALPLPASAPPPVHASPLSSAPPVSAAMSTPPVTPIPPPD